jgi:O-antigen ligase
MSYSAPRSDRRTGKIAPTGGFFHSPAVKFAAFIGFVIITVLLGGASRPDVWSLLLLRPVAFLFLGYACLIVSREQLAQMRGPIILLACLAALILLQLIPLPSAIWPSLPQRDVIYDVSKNLDLQNAWRPISLVPSRTLNSLLSLSVPAAALMLFASLDAAARKHVPLIIIATGIASMLLGLLQVAGPADGPLYTYDITNNGVMVGLFANRNHHAVFLACLLPLAAGLLFDRLSRKNAGKIDQNFLFIAATIALMVFVLPYVLLTGSRAGTLMAIAGLLMAALLWGIWLRQEGYRTIESPAAKGRGAIRRAAFLRKISLVPIVSGIVLAGVAAAVLLGRASALNRYQQLSEVEELRAQTFPVLTQMAETHFVFGAGFGSFEWLYKMWEPGELLMTNYLNQAHNDAAQWIIEGGLPAMAILGALLWMVGGRVTEIVSDLRHRRGISFVRIAASFVVLIIFAASVADYPLRTPIMMMVFSLIVGIVYVRAPPTVASRDFA